MPGKNLQEKPAALPRALPFKGQAQNHCRTEGCRAKSFVRLDCDPEKNRTPALCPPVHPVCSNFRGPDAATTLPPLLKGYLRPTSLLTEKLLERHGFPWAIFCISFKKTGNTGFVPQHCIYGFRRFSMQHMNTFPARCTNSMQACRIPPSSIFGSDRSYADSGEKFHHFLKLLFRLIQIPEYIILKILGFNT